MTKHEKELELAKAAAPKYGIYVSSAIKENTESLGDIILSILEARVDNCTMQRALDVLGKGVRVEASITGCSIDMGDNT